MPKVSINVNGRLYSIEADAQTTLLSALRDQLDLTGSKYGCGEGQCGAWHGQPNSSDNAELLYVPTPTEWAA